MLKMVHHSYLLICWSSLSMLSVYRFFMKIIIPSSADQVFLRLRHPCWMTSCIVSQYPERRKQLHQNVAYKQVAPIIFFNPPSMWMCCRLLQQIMLLLLQYWCHILHYLWERCSCLAPADSSLQIYWYFIFIIFFWRCICFIFIFLLKCIWWERK